VTGNMIGRPFSMGENMRVLIVAIGAVCGWLGSKLLFLVYSLGVVQGPERGFPDFAGIIALWALTFLCILLGMLVGYVVGQVFKQARVAPELKSKYRVGWTPFAAIGMIAIGLLTIVVGLPMQERIFRARASQHWAEQRANNIKLAKQLLASWQNEANEVGIGQELEDIFRVVTPTQVEFADATNQWKESDWLRFAQLAEDRPESFVGGDEVLWAKATDATISEASREKFARACFAFSEARNYSSDFWFRAMKVPNSDVIWKNILLEKLKREVTMPSNNFPWWLYSSSAIEVLEKLGKYQAELVPPLEKILARTESQLDPIDEHTRSLHSRLGMIVSPQ
jgi:hypothetical protein